MAEPRRIKTNAGWAYKVDIRVTGFPRKIKQFSKRRDAIAWRDKTMAEIRSMKADVTDLSTTMTATQLIDKFLDEMVETDYKSAVYRNDLKQRLTWWKTKIGDCFLATLNARILTDVRKEMVQGTPRRTPGTINRYFSALSAVFNKAVNEWQVMEYNPIKSIKPLKEPSGRTRWLDDDECSRLLKAAMVIESKPIYHLIVLAIATGARKSELLGIKRSNVLLEQKKIIIENTKNRSNRSLYVDGHPLEVVKDLLTTGNRKTYLFSTKRGDAPMSVDREWKEVLKAAKVKDFRFHDLRHTAAAYLAMNGATLNEIAELLGHKTLNMVKRYAHIADSHLKDVSGRVQKTVFNHQQKDQ